MHWNKTYEKPFLDAINATWHDVARWGQKTLECGYRLYDGKPAIDHNCLATLTGRLRRPLFRFRPSSLSAAKHKAKKQQDTKCAELHYSTTSEMTVRNGSI